MGNLIVCFRCVDFRWVTFALYLALLFVDFSFGAAVPGLPHIVAHPNPSLDGQEIRMSCLPGSQADGSKEAPPGGGGGRVVWRNGTETIPGAATEDVTVKADASLSSQFMCQREESGLFSLPFTPRTSHLLIASEPSAPVEDGQKVTLTCLTSAKLERSKYGWLEWARNDEEVEGSRNRSLKIEAKLPNPGFFECKVFAEVFIISAPYFIKVFPKTPKIRYSRRRLVCQSRSLLKAPVYVWLKDGLLIDRQHERDLDLRDAFPLHRNTRFACKVKEKGTALFSKLSPDLVLKRVPNIKPSKPKKPTPSKPRQRCGAVNFEPDFKPCFRAKPKSSKRFPQIVKPESKIHRHPWLPRFKSQVRKPFLARTPLQVSEKSTTLKPLSNSFVKRRFRFNRRFRSRFRF